MDINILKKNCTTLDLLSYKSEAQTSYIISDFFLTEGSFVCLIQLINLPYFSTSSNPCGYFQFNFHFKKGDQEIYSAFTVSTILVICFWLYAVCVAGAVTISSGEVLEINTTVPSIVKKNCPGCPNAYSTSLRGRSSSHGDHLVAEITFSDNIEFRSGSTVKVSGKYALSIASQNGHILIHTDVNMTCGEKVLNTTCLGGFTQSSQAEAVGFPGTYRSLYKGEIIFRGKRSQLMMCPMHCQKTKAYSSHSSQDSFQLKKRFLFN